MIDNNTKFEITNEVEIFCEDLKMMTMVTNRLFDPVIPYNHPDKHNRFQHTVPILNTKGAFQCNPCECGGHPDCTVCS